MTVWSWVRHGPTHQGTIVGWRDVPADLSDTDALRRLDRALPRDALLVSSDLDRAVRTADAIADIRTRLPHAHEIREFHFGDWEGLDYDEIAARDPDLSRRYWEQPGDVAPPGGESWNVVVRRVASFVDRMNRNHPGQHIIAVAHAGVIMTQIQRAGNLTPSQAIGCRIDNLSITRLFFDGHDWRTDWVNRLA